MFNFFKAGDEVYWLDDAGVPQYRTVYHVVGNEVWFTNGMFSLASCVFLAGEEPMPEVLTDARYECDIRPGRDSIQLDAESNESTIRVLIEHAGVDAIVALTPETALDLSADLMRMALKMKRKLDA